MEAQGAWENGRPKMGTQRAWENGDLKTLIHPLLWSGGLVRIRATKRLGFRVYCGDGKGLGEWSVEGWRCEGNCPTRWLDFGVASFRCGNRRSLGKRSDLTSIFEKTWLETTICSWFEYWSQCTPHWLVTSVQERPKGNFSMPYQFFLSFFV